MLALKQGAWVAVGSDEAGGVADPAVDQIFQTSLGLVIQYGGAPQGVEVAVGIQAQFAWAVVPMGKLLARVTERLEVADGVGMFEHGERDEGPVAILTKEPSLCAGSSGASPVSVPTRMSPAPFPLPVDVSRWRRLHFVLASCLPIPL